MGIELNSDQIFAYYEAEKWWHSADSGQVFEISGAAGTGKSLPMNTIIPTPNGDIPLGDLKVGDYVFNRHGKPVKILGVYDQGALEAYEVTLDDGRTAICSEEHLWSYYYKGKDRLQTNTLKHMMEKPLVLNDGGHRYQIPAAEAVEYSTKDFDVDPYVIGVFLGNRCCTSSRLSLSSDDVEVVEEVARLIGAKSYHKNPSSYTFELSDKDREMYIKEYGKLSMYKLHCTDILFKDNPELINLSHDRSIPRKYFYGDINQRWALIQGLFDTDGSITNTDRANIHYSTTSLHLVKDIKRVLASLGCSSTISKNYRVKDGKLEVYYNLYAKVGNSVKPNFFRLRRKKKIAEIYSRRDKNHDYTRNYIYNIRDLGYKTPMRCIYVDDPEHLYLCNDFIVTHNTTSIRYILQELGLDPLHDVLFVAFTGKAATQLARNGLPAITCHSAFYEYVKEIDRDEDGRMIILPNGKTKLKGVFRKKDHIKKRYKAICIDEGTMINAEMKEDILSFGLPVFVLGDMNQLPPVFGKPVFLVEPNVTLRKLMRQAEDNPIVYIAHRILDGYDLRPGVYESSAIIRKKDLNQFQLKNADIVLTVTNHLKSHINTLFREEYLSFPRLDLPYVGEKIICKRNDWSKSIGDNLFLTNGTTGFIEYVNRESYNGKSICLDFRPDFTRKTFRDLTVDYKRLMSLEKSETQSAMSFGMNMFEFAYAITVYASQGSQWDNVTCLYEDYGAEDFKRKVLYTMVTRAVNSVTLAI